jgi:hypothetical protein
VFTVPLISDWENQKEISQSKEHSNWRFART